MIDSSALSTDSNNLFLLLSECGEHIGGAVLKSLGRRQSLGTKLVVPRPHLCVLVVGDGVALDVVELGGSGEYISRLPFDSVLARAWIRRGGKAKAVRHIKEAFLVAVAGRTQLGVQGRFAAARV